MVNAIAIPKILIGTWSLLNTTPTDLNGVPKPPEEPGYGHHPTGQILYTPTHMSANIMSTDRAHRPASLAWPANTTEKLQNWAIVGRTTLHYAGPLTALEGSGDKNGRLIHGPLTVSNRPSWDGTPQERNYTLTEEEVTVEGEGGEVRKRLVLHLWARNETSKNIANLFWEKIA
ncbi:hypothetical protein K458DRAFT_492152 [Lentithecium fluviatile CBS 122367]|uniref:Lipocalin-like domain-containing protein n=1 Tax=Lentithecium fluviatile CBS 122367 TaxID=1168545 RepID=A0A6G1IFG8_9PLEO|nr:hypothetical protein K458DRAFT_492152 [Lentithecium fluviatile CBS 122367]